MSSEELDKQWADDQREKLKALGASNLEISVASQLASKMLDAARVYGPMFTVLTDTDPRKILRLAAYILLSNVENQINRESTAAAEDTGHNRG